MNGNVERQLAGPASTMLDQVDPLCVRTSGKGGEREEGQGVGKGEKGERVRRRSYTARVPGETT